MDTTSIDTVAGPIAATAAAWSLTPIQGVILFIAGIVFGALIYALWMRKRDANSPSSLAAEKKLQSYKQSVHQHLMQTTQQVQQLGTDYQNLVEHLQHIIHELDTSTPDGRKVVPHFPSARPHLQDEKSDVMPKTYVDRKK